uniref:Bromo domain-containing protein n=1 Tax=Ascaris lumbricoides TaxID=6252 RepID=A0A9J2P0D5_ASCLU
LCCRRSALSSKTRRKYLIWKKQIILRHLKQQHRQHVRLNSGANGESPRRQEATEPADEENARGVDRESEDEQSEDGEDASEKDDYFSTHPSATNEPWYIRHPELVDTAAEDADDEADELNDDDYEPVVDERFKGPPFVPPSQRDDAPLAGILQNPELDKIDPRRFFPEYSQDGILRFSRIFGANIKSTSRTKIWWPLKSFRSGSPKADVKTENGEKATDERGEENEEKADGEKDESEHKEVKNLELEFGTTPPPEECQISDEVLLMRPSNVKAVGKEHIGDADDEDVPPWRFGPARIWYDRFNVPASSTHFDYGFKLKREWSLFVIFDFKNKTHAKSSSKEKPEEGSENGLRSCEPFPPETFLAVNLVRWEDDIIIDGEQARPQILKRLASGKQPEYGWVPTQQTRSYESFMAALKSNAFEQMFAKPGTVVPTRAISDFDFPKEPTATHSIFPMDNYDLINTRWEDDIILDAENMDHIPEPHILTLDYHDDPKIFGMPEDKAPEEKPPDGEGVNPPKPFDRKEHQFTKKSKMILGQVQQRQKQEEDEQMESSIAQLTDKDPFNLSNDDYYLPKNTGRTVSSISGGSLIQHSIPAQNIHRTFFPTHLNPFKLRHYHRLPLPKRILRTTGTRYVPIKTLTKLIKEKEELREKQKAAEGGGEIFFMREVEDLSGKDGTLLLMEYSEEHPPLLNQPGMASKIRNYYKRKVGKEADPEYDFGETAFTHTSPFLGTLAPGQSLQSLENNLYRAPIYRHLPNRTDFLLIRTKQGFFIRMCPTLFLVGQECPLYEVPSPNSKRATVFVRDFLLAYIYRLFWASDQNPRRLKMEDIKAAFPHYAESSVRKRLKQCSDFKRLGQGPDQNYWVLRSDFRLPSKEEVLAMVTPEMCCAQYSMLAAEQRLKDAGYGEKYFFTPENEDDSDDQVTIEDEIKCAPWNTTRAYISSMKGKCLLDQTGIADPTGCGEGFSYVRVSAKPQKAKEEVPNVPKRLVTGTNADLRKLPLKEAKEICRDYGVREEEINSLSRWEIIDVIRTLSTQAAKARSDFSGMARFARGNIRFNFADMQEKYKKFCQRIFDLQNQTLSNPDELSTDEGSSGEDSDNEELATKLESMLAANKGKKGLSAVERKKLEFEQEEKERKALQKMLSGDVSAGTSTPKPEKEQGKESQKDSSVVTEDSNHTILSGSGPRKLKIYRTFKGPDGIESTRVEVITRPQLIEAYVRIRTTRDNTFIQVYAQMDEQYKEVGCPSFQCLTDILDWTERRKEKRRLQDQLRRIRRNELKAKLHGVPIGQPINKAKPAAEKKPVVIKPNLLKMRCSACHGTGHMKTNKNCPLYGKDSNKAPTKTVGDIHPVALTDEQLEKMAVPSGELIAVEGTKLKISRKLYAHTEMIKKNAVRLHIPRELIAGDKKIKEEDEMSNATGGEPEEGMVHEDDDVDSEDDVQGIDETLPSNSKSRTSVNTNTSRRRSAIDMDDYLYGPQKSVQRRRADPRVSMSIQLNEIFGDLRALPGTEHLMFPVNAKKVPDYYTIIKNPMDMQTIKKKISENKYELRRQFLADIKQMLDNSRVYNGDNHVITETARKVFEVASVRLMEREPKLISLEKAINPLLDDNDIIGFSFILNEIIQECKNLPKSVAFHTKVDAKKVPLYYKKIERPMDLGTMEQNIKEHRYTTVDAFRRDILQIKVNSELYNGPPETSQYTTKAIEICELAERMLEARKEQLSELEANIQATLNENAEVESVAASSAMDDGEVLSPGARLSNIKEEDIEDEEDEIIDHLQDDLALSGDEDDVDDEDHEMSSNWDPTGEVSLSGYDAEGDLLQSQMHSSGQLNADLALSDSDEDDDDQFISAKRPKLEDLTTL